MTKRYFTVLARDNAESPFWVECGFYSNQEAQEERDGLIDQYGKANVRVMMTGSDDKETIEDTLKNINDWHSEKVDPKVDARRKYHAAEMQRHIAAQARRNNDATANRKAARQEWQDYLTDYPEQIEGAVSLILNGDYGYAPAYLARKMVITSSRKTAAAYLGQMVACLDCGTCEQGARAGYRALSGDQQETATAYVLSAINDWVDNGGTWTRAD